MRNLKKPTSAMLIAVMLITNSNGIFAYSNEQKNQTDLKPINSINKTTTSTIQEISETEENITWTEVSTAQELDTALKDEKIEYIKFMKDIEMNGTYYIGNKKIIDGNNHKFIVDKYERSSFFTGDPLGGNIIELRNIDLYGKDTIIEFVSKLIINNSTINAFSNYSTGHTPVISDCNNIEIYNSELNSENLSILYGDNIRISETTLNMDNSNNYAISSHNAEIDNVTVKGTGQLLYLYQNNNNHNYISRVSNIDIDERFSNEPAFLVEAGAKLELDGKYTGNKYIASKKLSFDDQSEIDFSKLEIDGEEIIENKQSEKIDYRIKHSDDDTVIQIPDKNLKQRINETLGKNPYSDLIKGELESINKLELSEAGIKDLTGIEYCKNLIMLDLRNNEHIKNIEPLKNLTNLQILYLQRNNIVDISPLSNLINLKSLDISFNNIENISSISRLIKLEDLDISYNKVNDISSLKDLVKLKWFRFNSSNIEDISVVKNFINLELIALINNKVSDLSPLDSLEKLRYCYVEGQKINFKLIFTKDNKIEIEIPNVYDKFGHKLEVTKVYSGNDFASKDYEYTIKDNKIIIEDTENIWNRGVVISIQFKTDFILDSYENRMYYDVKFDTYVNKLVDGLEVIDEGLSTKEQPTVFEIKTKDALYHILSEMNSVNISILDSFRIEDNYKIYKFCIKTNKDNFVEFKVNLNQKEIIEILDDRFDIENTPKPPVDGGEDKPQPPILDGIDSIEGVEVFGGNGTENSPKILEVKTKEALDIFIQELDDKFTYKIVGKPRIEGDYKIYKVKVDKKQRMFKSVDKSNYIEIKVDKDNTQMVKKLDQTLDVKDEATPQPPATNPIPPIGGGSTGSGDNNYVPPIKPETKPEQNTKPEIVVELTDIKNHWAESNIIDFASKGYISGYKDKSFKPDDSMTRAEVVSLISRIK